MTPIQPKARAEATEARKIAERIAALEDHDCRFCGERLGGLAGHMARGSDGGWLYSHGFDEKSCARANSVDHQTAYSIASTILMRISEWAWEAFTEDLTDDEWEALPRSVKEALAGIHVLASDATSTATYEGLAIR